MRLSLLTLSLLMLLMLPTAAKSDIMLRFDEDGASINIDEERYYKMRRYCRKPWHYYEDECHWLRKLDRERRKYYRRHKKKGFSLDFDF